MNSSKLKIVFFQRKQRALGNFSIESYFTQVRDNLPNRFSPKLCIVPFESNGIIKRIFNAVYCVFHQGDINHITGDIHYIAIFLKKQKTVLTVHDCGILHSSTGIKQAIIKYFWFTLPISRCAAVTCVSQATKKDLAQYVNLNGKRVDVIYVSISTSFRKNDKKFNNKIPQVLQIGTGYNKNLLNLIPALENINCRLVIVGKIDNSILELLAKFNINYLNLSHKLSEQEIIQLYIDSDIVAFVSTLEGFGMPIIEANVIGRVVMAGKNSSMIEVANDAAYFVNALDIKDIHIGFQEVIQNKELRQKLVNNGFRNALRFDIGKIVDNYCDIYDWSWKNQTKI